MVEIDDRFTKRLRGWAQSLSDDPRSSALPTDPLRLLEPEGVESGGLLRAHEVWSIALDLWKNQDDAFEFLTRKHAMLSDQRPIIAALQSEENMQAVKSIIGQLRYGSAA